jgi:polyphosphate kinase
MGSRRAKRWPRSRSASTSWSARSTWCFLDEIQPVLATEGVRILRPEDLDADQRRFLDQYFRQRCSPW